MSTPDNKISPNPVNSNPVNPSSAKKAPSVWEIYYPRKLQGHQNTLYLSSFPEIIFFWPTIVISFFCAFIQAVGLVDPVTAGWIFTVVILFNFLVLVQDFDQKQFIIVCLASLAFFLLVWIANLYGIGFFKSIAAWISTFRPVMSTDFYVLSAVMFTVYFVWGCIGPLFSYWMISQNEFVHFTQPVGRDTSIARIGCTISKEIPDVLESLLSFGGGTLVIKRDNQVLASIRNIPFLALRMDAIEHMLAETRVTVSEEH